ncbi:MAG: FMN-binding protein [Spirochaetota bacterium]|nr:FMN-binding protein [Spirochaetota bacterium]
MSVLNKDGLVYTVIISVVSAFLFVFLLSLAHGATKGKVEENQKLTEARAYLVAAGIEVDEDIDIEAVFNTNFPKFDAESTYQTTTVNGKSVVVSPFQGNGLWGTITGVLGMTADLQRIVGFEIVSHVETPGLGGRIDEVWFKEQFKGEFAGNGIIVKHGGSGGDTDPDNGEVDGITGASRTSDSIQVIVNQQIDKIKLELGGTN